MCRFALHVPENLSLAAAAPLLCAGITTYSPMKHYGLDKAGQKLAVVGLGGLGHMAVKFGKGELLDEVAPGCLSDPSEEVSGSISADPRAQSLAIIWGLSADLCHC